MVRVTRNREDGVTLQQIAKDFGVHPMTLNKWLRQERIDTTSATTARSAGPADVGDYSRNDATAGGPAPAATMPTTKIPTVLVPDMIGSRETTARQRAAATDLPYTIVHQAVTDPALDGIVVDQDPISGTRGRAGDTITLAVGRYTAPTTAPTPATEATKPATNADGYTPKKIEVPGVSRTAVEKIRISRSEVEFRL